MFIYQTTGYCLQINIRFLLRNFLGIGSKQIFAITINKEPKFLISTLCSLTLITIDIWKHLMFKVLNKFKKYVELQN